MAFEGAAFLQLEEHRNITLQYSVAGSHLLGRWLPAQRLVLYHRTAGRKVNADNFGFVHEAVTFEAVTTKIVYQYIYIYIKKNKRKRNAKSA